MDNKVEVDIEKYKYGFNYGLICNFVKNINSQFELYKENIPISNNEHFIEGFKMGVKEKLNIEYIEECFYIKDSIHSIFINFEDESQKIRNLYSVFLLAILSGFNMAIDPLIFWFAMLLLFIIISINNNLFNDIIDLLHQHNYNRLISSENEIVKEKGNEIFRSLDDFKVSPIGLIKVIMFLLLVLVTSNYSDIYNTPILYNGILAVICIMIFSEFLIDFQKIIIRLNTRKLNLWQCFFPLEVNPKVDILFIKTLSKYFWIRLELFTHIWNALSLLLISLYCIFIGSDYGLYVSQQYFWASWSCVFYDIIITSLIRLSFSKNRIRMKHHTEKTTIIEYIFLIGRFLELTFSGIFIWFLLNPNSYLVEHVKCDQQCQNRCGEFIISICFITFCQALSVPVIFSETLTTFFLNIFSLLFLLGFTIDFITRIVYLSIIWGGRSLLKAVKLCINVS